MPATTFNLTGSGVQNGATIAVGANEKVRVRFSSIAGQPDFYLVIVANGVTSLSPIDLYDGWLTPGVLSGDTVNVRMIGFKSTDNGTGALESG